MKRELFTVVGAAVVGGLVGHLTAVRGTRRFGALMTDAIASTIANELNIVRGAVQAHADKVNGFATELVETVAALDRDLQATDRELSRLAKELDPVSVAIAEKVDALKGDVEDTRDALATLRGVVMLNGKEVDLVRDSVDNLIHRVASWEALNGFQWVPEEDSELADGGVAEGAVDSE